MAITTWLYRVVGSRFRKRRMKWFVREFRPCQNVVDVGGEAHTWREYRPVRVVLLNVEKRPPDLDGLAYVQGDGRALPFPDQAFDLAYSNSVIEHVGDLNAQRRFASELQRVGRRVYCQTPNKWFPVETHSLGLLLHWFPETRLLAWVYRYLSLQGRRVKPTPEECLARMRSVHLLTRKELAALFPGHHIRTERFAGLAKSFIAWR